MSSLKTIWDCMFSPKLIKIYGNGPVEKFYEPNTLETWGNKVINSLYVMWKLGVYTSPVIIGYLYQRGYFEAEGLLTLSKLVTSVGVILVISVCIRGLSRAENPTYRKFLNTLQSAHTDMTPEVKRELNKYDFEFYAWPVEYKSLNDNSYSHSIMIKPSHHNIISEMFYRVPCKVIAYFAIHSFGIRLMYPGTIGFLQLVLEQSLLQGRSRLIDLYQGERFKIQTADNNDIDAMFINRRNGRSDNPNGNTLVICCEGNAGFYEIGITITPIEAGYSVLGWNHPGFGGSTGKPYPSQEQNAVDAVIQFALNKLNFKIENILLFGWSIGGYSSSWAAMMYPDIKGVILDASFDDVLPLALNHMPKWWEPIVEIAIRDFLNLNVGEQLCKYPGPVLIIRRTDDEVICTRENDISTNRGNYLALKLLQHRYPCIFDDVGVRLLFDYLSAPLGSQEEFFKKYDVDDNLCQSLLQSYISEYSKSYPMKFGEELSSNNKSRMVLFLAKKYMKDFRATHCVNLSADMFQPPWDVNVEADFIFT